MWFGPKSWGAAVCVAKERITTPVGQTCHYCDEVFTLEDKGLQNAKGQSFHLECSIRMIAGSAAHQLKKCSCYGGNWEDLPDLTKRQAAKMAWEVWTSEQERELKQSKLSKDE